jgi:hypothetical protein
LTLGATADVPVVFEGGVAEGHFGRGVVGVVVVVVVVASGRALRDVV